MAQRYFTENKHDDEQHHNNKVDGLRNSFETKKIEDPFQGDAPISESRKKIYRRGNHVKTKGIKNKKLKGVLKSVEKHGKNAEKQAARFEMLMTEEAGFIEADANEETWKLKQQDIADSVDIASASKHFQLHLDQFGPYCIDYTRNGRHLLIGGHRGHVAAFDWMTKRLMCEMNVMESVMDVKWLHTENMFAVAQRRWTYIYDNQGIELHCLKRLDQTLKLDFLPYHFLLVAANARGFLQYLDVSRGEIISSVNTKAGRLNVLSHNPNNAVTLLGHQNGTVSMWSPNQREPLVKMLCHKAAVRAVAVDQSGGYLATSGQDRKVNIFDIRTFKPLHTRSMSAGPSQLQFSQRRLLAATSNDVVEIYKDPCLQFDEKPYLSHRLRHTANDLMFCAYEDVLGVGCADGFVSLLVPGAGEPNYDALESNPHRSKKQRREWEVKALMEKIQPDMITLDPFQLSRVDYVTTQQLENDREERLGFKPMPPKFELRFKKKGRSKSGNVEKRKRIRKNESLRGKIRSQFEEKRNENDAKTPMNENIVSNEKALNRFVKNKK